MKQKSSVLAATLIVLILFSVIVFVVPIPKTGVFWLSYVFAVIAVVAQLGFVYVAFGGGSPAKSKFYGFPVFRIGMLYLIVQVALSLVFMLLGGLVPLWLPFLLYVVVLGLAAVGLIAADNVRDAVQMVDEKRIASTAVMERLRQDAEALKVVYPELDKLAEALRYSDPVATDATVPLERQLHSMLVDYQKLPDYTSRVRCNKQMLDLLAQRNALCKAGKTK